MQACDHYQAEVEIIDDIKKARLFRGSFQTLSYM